jgi:hypothetical protein
MSRSVCRLSRSMAAPHVIIPKRQDPGCPENKRWDYGAILGGGLEYKPLEFHGAPVLMAAANGRKRKESAKIRRSQRKG